MNDIDAVCYFGSAVKALGDGRIGGILVPFGTPETADVQGEYFTPETDFGLEDITRLRAVYHHGFTKALGRKRIGSAVATMTAEGIAVEATLDLNDPAVKSLHDAIVSGRPMWWSSGSANHLVERTAVKGAYRIDSWPLIEASLTPKPVDPRARAHALKGLIDRAGDNEDMDPLRLPGLVDRAEALVADAEAIAGLFHRAADSRKAEGRNLSPVKRESIKAVADALAALHAATVPPPSEAEERRAELWRRLILQRINR